jgi:tetratricopeptide (TPR) repeat protein
MVGLEDSARPTSHRRLGKRVGRPTTYEYLLTGRRNGRRRTEIVSAATADAAVADFEADGYSDIVAHTDDTTAPLARPSQSVQVLSPARMVWLRTAGPAGLAGHLVVGFYRLIWFVPAGGAAFLAFTRVMDWPWELLDVVAVGALLLPLALALYFALVGRFGASRRLGTALGSARWEEVLRLLERTRVKGHTFDYHLHKAQALAGLGRLPEALREFDRVTDLPDVPDFLYWLHQSLIYLAAGERERMLDVLRRAREAAPAASAITILLAHNLVVIRREVGEARRLLAEARRHVISDVLAPYAHSLEGVLALEEGRPEEAIAHLTTGLGLHRPFARTNPMLRPQEARMRARLALAHAAAGDRTAAREQFRRARPILVAHREDDLIRRCEEATDEPGEPSRG